MRNVDRYGNVEGSPGWHAAVRKEANDIAVSEYKCNRYGQRVCPDCGAIGDSVHVSPCE